MAAPLKTMPTQNQVSRYWVVNQSESRVPKIAIVSQNSGFTLIEILITIGIIAILVVLATVGLERSLDRAQQAQCTSNIRQTAAALLAYAAENGGILPHSLDKKVPNDPTSSNVFWADRLMQGGYLTTWKVLYCPKQKDRPNPLSAAYIGYGSNRYGLMPHWDDAAYHQVSLGAITRPSSILLLAESRVLAQPHDGWYEFWPSFNGLTFSDDENFIVYPRHGKKAGVAFADGHIEFRNVRDDLFKQSTKDTDPPWYNKIYTK